MFMSTKKYVKYDRFISNGFEMVWRYAIAPFKVHTVHKYCKIRTVPHVFSYK